VVSTHLKNISQNGNLSPGRDENNTYLKPPPRKSLGLFVTFAQQAMNPTSYPTFVDENHRNLTCQETVVSMPAINSET